MNAAPASSLVRPSLNTRFHIDYDWWDRAERDLEVYLRSHLCPTHQESYADVDPARKVDHVDPETGEVTRVAGIQHVLISHCAQQPGYLSGQTSLVNAVFRVFLSNGNTPLSPEELGERIGRPAQMILRTLTGPRVYKGIRPYITV
ncbi:MAG TPA: hypothetical protein VJ345_04300 [Anaerolineales bacterium]|nr:hypothetical protein [Anaerolineales bacterium]